MSVFDDSVCPNFSSDNSDIIGEPFISTIETLPFTELYGSPDNVMNDLQDFAESQGFSFSKIRTKKHNPPRVGIKVGVMVIGCSKGAKIQASLGTKRKRPSKMTECPFRLTARENEGAWNLKLNCGDHNHAALDATAHSSHRNRAMTTEKVERIRYASQCGIRPRQILNEFRAEDPECKLKLIDIYNKKRDLRAAELKNNTPTQALALALGEREHWFHVLEKNPESQQITRLFMAHLPTAHRDIALINAIRNLYPRVSIILCIWHINMDVRAHATRIMSRKEEVDSLMKDWEVVVYSQTVSSYAENWNRFEEKYSSFHNLTHLNSPGKIGNSFQDLKADEYEAQVQQDIQKRYERVLAYLKESWLQPWEHHFVKCYTNRQLHFDTTTTQRAESAHRALKAQLGFSTGSLFTVVNSIELLLENQLKDWRQRLNGAKNVVAHQHRIPMFRKLINFVPGFGLWKVYEQYERVMKSLEPNGQPLEACTGTYEKTMGLPCSHRIAALYRNRSVLKPEDLHSHWLYSKPKITSFPS
ncbi:Transposase [Thalictrum thalictroides]|uniref:Transposase n=1 Tax=Thalictrum thalictroides TaxID=46969 RepID=A0A7J6W9T2_THATH|nr:Transposase [Thalictrum thalictroides]